MVQKSLNYSVTEAVSPEGDTEYFIGHSDYYLPKELKVNLNPNEVPVTKIPGHAEVTSVEGTLKREQKAPQ
jgi:hypothetical protein